MDMNRSGTIVWQEMYNWIIVQMAYSYSDYYQKAAMIDDYYYRFLKISLAKGYFTQADLRRYTLTVFRGPIVY